MTCNVMARSPLPAVTCESIQAGKNPQSKMTIQRKFLIFAPLMPALSLVEVPLTPSISIQI